MINMQGRCFKIFEITSLIKETLESQFYSVMLEGEISNFRPSSTGHYYFSLKDSKSMISAVMFKNAAKNLDYIPADGELVKVKGDISVYPQRGSYQIICSSIEKSGEGNILAELEKRKKRLAEEGLFNPDLKKQLPRFPEKVAVVTSPTGAAIKDILRVLKRRNNKINLIILPAPVQGNEAAGIIAKQIRYANSVNIADVLIIGRGGGSLEDLLPFSDEDVVRAVYESEIPFAADMLDAKAFCHLLRLRADHGVGQRADDRVRHAGSNAFHVYLTDAPRADDANLNHLKLLTFVLRFRRTI